MEQRQAAQPPDQINPTDFDRFSEEWLGRLGRYAKWRVNGSRLPNDFWEDLLQAGLLAAVQQARTHPAETRRAYAVRLSKDVLTHAIAGERKYYRRFPVRLDDRDGQNSGWRDEFEFKHACTDPTDVNDDTDEGDGQRAQDLMHILTQRLNRRERKFLELRYLTVAPGKKRPYTIKEIADLWGRSYDYLRHFSLRTLAKVRRLAAEAGIRATTRAE